MNNNINYYAYLRVSTNKQKVDRQEEALKEWQEKNNINIPSENIFTDYYTGKTFDRENYQRLISEINANDYLIIKEVDRLGRDWDGIKKEWENLKNRGINIIIIDTPILSDNLPNEKPIIEGLVLKLIREQIFSLMCYTAQEEREKISQRTKEELQAIKKSGKILGRPPKNDRIDKYLSLLEYIITNKCTLKKGLEEKHYNKTQYYLLTRKYENIYKTDNIKIIYKKLKQEVKK